MYKPIQFLSIPSSYQFWIQLIKPCPNVIIFMMGIPAISNRPNVRTTIFLNVFQYFSFHIFIYSNIR